MQRRSKELHSFSKKKEKKNRRKNNGRRLSHREESPTMGGSVRIVDTVLGSLSGPRGLEGTLSKHTAANNTSFDP